MSIESHHQSNAGCHPSNTIHAKEASGYGEKTIADSNENVISYLCQ